jgi:hypothetical protein
LLARATSLRQPWLLCETFVAACSIGNEAVAKIALEEGSFDMSGSSGYIESGTTGVHETTALVAAAERGNISFVGLVLAKNDMRADKIKGDYDKRKTNQAGIYNGHGQVIRVLLSIIFQAQIYSLPERILQDWFVQAAAEGHVHLMDSF